MRFAPVRDYRTKEHPGRSGATSLNYDEAVHVNRRAPFGVVEIQAMTHDLLLRAFRVQGLEESHRRFAQRRTRARRGSGGYRRAATYSSRRSQVSAAPSVIPVERTASRTSIEG